MLTCAALILNHNGRDLLPPLFDSLRIQEGLTAICLIDNASTDDSIELTRELYPEVQIIKNQENLNFGTAYNRAVATRSEDVILILNNDLVVRPDSVRHALNFLETNPDVASVSFEGLDPNKSEPFPCSSLPLRRFGKVLSPARHFTGPNDKPTESPHFVWGAAACIRREVFLKVKFDEAMDWGFEDVDLGWSITRQTGMRNVFLPSATVYHLDSHSTQKRFRQSEIDRMITRNAILSFIKNATFWELARAAPYILLNLPRSKSPLNFGRALICRLLARH